jgi:TetR/AcrR family fatty acid metabolism transcriptional regulator
MTKVLSEKRQEIIRATFEAIADRGFGAVTLQNIADYVGVSKGVISYYFSNKDDVFLHLLEWLTDRIHRHEQVAVDAQTDPIEKLKAYINTAFIGPEENKKFYRVYLDFLAQGSRDARYRAINNVFYENCWSLGRGIVEAGCQAGIFHVTDTEDAAVMIRASIDGNLIQWLMRGEMYLHGYYRDLCYQTILRYLKGIAS